MPYTSHGMPAPPAERRMPHPDDALRASVTSAVKRVLHRRGLRDAAALDEVAGLVLEQARRRWRDWPEAA